MLNCFKFYYAFLINEKPNNNILVASSMKYQNDAEILRSKFINGNGKSRIFFQGDSGGPLMVKTSSDNYVLAGITSYGVEHCGQSELPGRFYIFDTNLISRLTS